MTFISGRESLRMPEQPRIIRYERSGGFFITVKKLLIILLFLFALITAGIIFLMFSISETEDQITTEGKIGKDKVFLSDYERTLDQILIHPTFYRVKLQVRLKEKEELDGFKEETTDFTYNGTIWISIMVKKNLRGLWLDAKDLRIEDIKIFGMTNYEQVAPTYLVTDGPSASPSMVTEPNNEKEKTKNEQEHEVKNLIIKSRNYKYIEISQIKLGKEKIELRFKEALKAGENYTLKMLFFGNLKQLDGFYYSYYNTQNETKYYALTYFLNNSIKTLFPCFEDPILTSKFKISIARRENTTIIGNSRIKTSSQINLQPGWFWDDFEATKPISISTINLAFLQGYFTIQTKYGDVIIQVHVRDDYLDSAEFIIKSIIKLFKFYTEYFGNVYPNNKLDIFGVDDLIPKITGTPGFITVRNEYFLSTELDPDIQKSRKILVSLISHELATHWIYSLNPNHNEMVTAEGLAVYISAYSLDMIQPLWNSIGKYVVTNLQNSLLEDSFDEKVNSINQFDKRPDYIFFNKYAAIFRMINNVVGDEIFEKGVQQYTQSSSKTNFWDILCKLIDNSTVFSGNFKMTNVLQSWKNNPGYPLLNVKMDYENGTVELTQEKFLLNGGKEFRKWYIPIYYTFGYNNTPSDIVKKIWLSEQEMIIKDPIDFTFVNHYNWIIFNLNSSSLLRVNYDETNWKRLIQVLETSHEIFTSITRAQLLDDVMNLAISSHVPYELALNLTMYLKNEKSYLVWTSFKRNIQFFDQMLSTESIYKNFIDYLNSLIEDHLAIEDSIENEENMLLQETILDLACHIENFKCIKWAQDNYQNMTNLASYQKLIIYSTVIKLGSRREWESLLDKAKEIEHKNQTEYKIILKSLASTKIPWQLKSLLNMAFINNEIKMFHFNDILNSISAPKNLFTFIFDNFKEIYNNFRNYKNVLRKIYKTSFKSLNQQSELNFLLNLYETHREELKPFAKLIARCIEKIRVNIYWRQNHYSFVKKWLENF